MQTQIASAAQDSLKTAADSVKWSLNGIESIIAGEGIMISIVGMIIVFVSLLLLVWMIKGVTLSVLRSERIAKQKAAKALNIPADASQQTPQVSGEVIAAIAMAMNEFLYEIHDEEKTVVTIQRISRPYSPWSSKLHSMTRPPLHLSKRG